MPTDTLQLIDEWGPEKVVCVSDRRSGMRGVLVIDNSARGIGKGGTRMSPNLSVTEVARLARTMTWKWAAVDLFHQAEIMSYRNTNNTTSSIAADLSNPNVTATINGTSLVNVPAIAFLFVTKHTGQGIGLIIWWLGAVSIIDNFVGPKFISGRVRIHILLLIFSIIGGLQVFGALGFLIGPLVMIFFWSILEMFQDRDTERELNEA